MSERFINIHMAELKLLERQKAALEEKIKQKQNLFKSFMTANGIEELQGENGERIVYKEILASRFDLKSFREHYEYLYETFLKNTRSLRFKFTY